MGSNVDHVLSMALWQEFTKHRPKCILVDDMRSMAQIPAEKRSSKHPYNVYTPKAFDATYVAWRAADVALFLCEYTPAIDDEIFLYTHLTDHPWDTDNQMMWVFEVYMRDNNNQVQGFQKRCEH